MCRKYKGVKARWMRNHFILDATGQQVSYKKERRIYAPKWFRNEMPSCQCISGELYLGPTTEDRKLLGEITAKLDPYDSDWDQIRFYAFDIRKEYFYLRNHHFRTIDYLVCNSNEHAQEYLDQVAFMGGDTIVLIAPSGRCYRKTQYEYAEDEVVAWYPGVGRNNDGIAGKIGLNRDYRVFKMDLHTKELRLNPPPIGSIVRYRHKGMTPGNVPMNPTFVSYRRQ